MIPVKGKRIPQFDVSQWHKAIAIMDQVNADAVVTIVAFHGDRR